MAGPINKLPWGLLGWLGVKNFGQYPNQLVESIQPQLDMLGITAANDLKFAFDVSSQITALNFNPTTIVVPQGELWYVPPWHFSVFYLTAAGQAVTAAAAVALPDGHILVPATRIVLPASAQARLMGNGGSPLWLPSGTTLGHSCDSITAGPIVAQAFLSYVRMPL